MRAPHRSRLSGHLVRPAGPLRLAPSALPALLIACAAVCGDALRRHRAAGAASAAGGSAAGSKLRERMARSSATLAQLRTREARREDGDADRVKVHKELFTVKVNFDLEDFEPSDGLTMVFDKPSHAMMLNSGLMPQGGFAWGRFKDDIQTSGWAELYMETTPTETGHNDAKMYAAGYAEGLLTSVRISEHYANTYRLLMRRGRSQLGKIKDLLQNEMSYMRLKTNLVAYALTNEPEDAYWKQVRYVAAQLWGVCDGYNFAARHFGVHTLELEDLILLNMGAELSQIIDAFASTSSAAPASLLQLQSLARHGAAASGGGGGGGGDGSVRREAAEAAERRKEEEGKHEEGLLFDDAHWEKRVAASGHCSAFIRVGSGNTDLFVGHTTWDDYSKMLRVFKYYKFPLEGADTMASHIGFPSYPGAVSSTDDYYVMSSGLAVMATSLVVLNPAVWLQMPTFPATPHIPNFAHVMAVNRLASNAVHWSRLYTAEMPASYAAQWMAVDYNRFQKGAAVADNTLWVVETLPGVTHAEDASSILRNKGYWASYDRPYFDVVRVASGHADAQRSHGALYSWGDNPRAKIFAGAAAGTNTLYDMRGLMSRNMYPYAGVAPNEPGHEISARMDLDRISPLPNGGIDAKVTNRCLAKNLQVQAVSGPSHSKQAPFSWKNADGSDSWPGWPHLGQPDRWAFDFVQQSPTADGEVTESGDC